MTHNPAADTNLRQEHLRTLRRIKTEGLAWALLWGSGSILAMIATFSR